MKRSWTCFAVMLFAGVFLATNSAAQGPVAYVADVTGTWVVNGSSALARGQKLTAGSSIRRRSSTSDDRISIVEMSGKPLDSASRDCARGNCAGAIRIPGSAAGKSWSDTAGEVAVGIYRYFRDTVLPAAPPDNQNLSRSGEISDDVVKLDGDIADLSSVVKVEGEQYLRWRTISLTSAGGKWRTPARMDKTALVSGFRPGLFEINLMRSNGSGFESLASAWILVATSEGYPTAKASFQDMQKLAGQWSEKVKPETTELLFRVALQELAAKAKK